MRAFLDKLLVFSVILSIILLPSVSNAGIQKWIRVGQYWKSVVDSGDEGEGNIAWGTLGLYHYDAFNPNSASWESKAWYLGVPNWTDENGKTWAVKTSGHGQLGVDEERVVIPIPDENGLTLKQYLRYEPAAIVVDGFIMNDPFPLKGDEVNASKIPGTADIMMESHMNTDLGVSINQKVMAWSVKNHDDYLLLDWTFTNTGNIDLDDDIELPNQTLKNLHYLRYMRAEEIPRSWFSSYGQHPDDTLRLPIIAEPNKQQEATFDNYGNIQEATGNILNPMYKAEATLHAPVSATDPSNDPAQPSVTGWGSAESGWTYEAPTNLGESLWADAYTIMSEGQGAYDGMPQMDASVTYPNTHHSVRMDGPEKAYKYVQDYENMGWAMAGIYSYGPYDLEPSQSIRIVWADVTASISRDKGWEVGKAWLAGSATFEGDGGKLPVRYELYGDELSPTANDLAKTRWVRTGMDSLHKNVNAAQWAFDNNYQVPTAPPAPSITVSSKPDKIEIEWGSESEAASDFAGYRIYRATGKPDTTWNLIADYPGSGTHLHSDITAQRGVGYYYYISAYDDGTDAPGVYGVSEVHESGRFLNRTTKAAYLTRPAGSVGDVVVVPNPFHIGASELQYVGEQDKIMFLNVPGNCTIRIFSENGDLVRQIEHTDGSGDQAWGVLQEEWSSSRSGQKVVSGIYIAHIEDNDTGDSNIVKFFIVR